MRGTTDHRRRWRARPPPPRAAPADAYRMLRELPHTCPLTRITQTDLESWPSDRCAGRAPRPSSHLTTTPRHPARHPIGRPPPSMIDLPLWSTLMADSDALRPYINHDQILDPRPLTSTNASV